MKKVITLALALVMVFTIVACSGKSDVLNDDIGKTSLTMEETSTLSTEQGLNQPVQSDTLDAQDDSFVASDDVIQMPDGFPTNKGDAEYFKPITDDYIYYNNSSVDTDGIYGRVYLVSYDTNGEVVQFAAKWVYKSSADVSPDGFMDEYDGVALSQGITIENAVFIDYMSLDDGQLEKRLIFYDMPKVKSDLANIPTSMQTKYYISQP